MRLPFTLAIGGDVPSAVRAAAVEAVDAHPEVQVLLRDHDVDRDTKWMAAFHRAQHVTLQAPHLTDLSWLEQFSGLRSLNLGGSRSARRSLSFLAHTPALNSLSFGDGVRDLDLLMTLESLKHFAVRKPKLKSLQAIAGHPAIEVVEMSFGGIRDLSPIVQMPRLRGLDLYQIRLLDAEDVDVLGDCEGLVAVSLGALRNVTSLRALARGSRDSLRYLILERLTGLCTIADLADCPRLEEVCLIDSATSDGDLDLVRTMPSLRSFIASGRFPRDQLQRVDAQFSERSRGVRAAWRASVQWILEDVDGDASSL